MPHLGSAPLLGSACECSWPVIRFDSIDSTNAEARRRAELGDVGPCWLVADRQESGRGRLGRVWRSPVGNLAATALFQYDGQPTLAPALCFAAGTALVAALLEFAPELEGRALLKWPNDLVSESGKLAGILVETGASCGRMWVAVGIGLNLAEGPSVSEQATTSVLDLAGVRIAPVDFIQSLDATFRRDVGNLLRNGFDGVRSSWERHARDIGQNMSVLIGNEPFSGIMEGLADDGALILRDNLGQRRDVRAGDVQVIKK